MLLMEVRQDLWLEDSLRERELIMKRNLLQEARYTSIRTIMAPASMMTWDLHHMDVKTTFLNGMIDEEVYIEQPQGFEVKERRTHVCKLKKSLYGLKQAPRAWYGRINSFLTKVDPKLYFKVIEDKHVILLLYVDDLFLTGNEK